MPKYLVKFIKKKYLPDSSDLGNCKIRLGTFDYYRKIEDPTRADRGEGQRGLDLVLKKRAEVLKTLLKERIIFIMAKTF